MIKFEDFEKIDLRIAKIEQVEKIDNSDRLLKLIVNIGNERKTIVAGIGKKYDTEELLGQLIVLVVNLEPKKIKGIKSEGMILAADNKGEPVLIVPLEQVDVGSRVR